ncbi:MAG: ATP phosphoribosyltransferase [Candidatus Woesearchaeota archaeon]
MIKLALPKGRLTEGVIELLSETGLKIQKKDRSYRLTSNDSDLDIKMFKTQNIPKLVELGSQDIAFTGADWVIEQDADIEELLDLRFNPVRIIAAVSQDIDIEDIKRKTIRVASEYENITRKYLKEKGYKFVFIRSYGATEVFIPEDADMIIDNTSSGSTLKANNLKVIDTVIESSTRFIANRDSMRDLQKNRKINNLLMLMKSAIEARKRVLLEMNVSSKKLDSLLPILPCMKSPTVSKLFSEEGYAVKIAIEKDRVPGLIPLLKEKGATDILVFNLQNVIV